MPSVPVRALLVLACLTTVALLGGRPAAAQHPAPSVPQPGAPPADIAPAATFRSRVNLVSVSAVVRDRRGKILSSLRDQDFEVLDEGQRRDVVLFRSGADAPAGVAILVDGSGSMAMGAARDKAQAISVAILSRLTAGRDLAALLSFDTRLLTLTPFTDDFDNIRDGLGEVEAFGSTSLYDAVAGSAAFVADRVQGRRALIVLTDGSDNASTHGPEEVAWIASTIDVPVYVFEVGTGPTASDEALASRRRGALAELARATGGDLFVASTPGATYAAIARLCDELRHQYVLGFEPAPGSGMRRVQLRTRNKDLRVTTRTWYRNTSE